MLPVVAANASHSSLNGETYQREQPKIMLEKLKAKADVGAPMRFISRTSWLHKTMLVMLTASLGQVAYSDWNCGNFIWDKDLSVGCLNSSVKGPDGNPVDGSTEVIFPHYNQCGGFYAGTHTGCIDKTILLDYATYRYSAWGCNTAVASITPASKYVYDAAQQYTCGQRIMKDADPVIVD